MNSKRKLHSIFPAAQPLRIQLRILIFLQILQTFKSDLLKRTNKYNGSIRQSTSENPFIENPENILAHYVIKEQEQLLETQGEKPSDLWIEHQKRRFLQSPSNNFTKFDFQNFSYKNNSQNFSKNYKQNNNEQKFINTNGSVKNYAFSISNGVKNLQKNDFSKIKSGGEVDTNIKLKDSKTNENLKNTVKVNGKIMLDPNDDYTIIEYKSLKNKMEKLRTNNEKGSFNITTPSFKGFLNFLKFIQTELISRAKNGIEDKILRLKNLRNTILLNVENRIEKLWSEKPLQRVKRSLIDDTNHEIFPTAETALMTISFLTFAVFLIKLVLQVINTFKSKHYSFNGFTLSNVEAIKTLNLEKNAKYLEDDEKENIEHMTKIISATEKYAN